MEDVERTCGRTGGRGKGVSHPRREHKVSRQFRAGRVPGGSGDLLAMDGPFALPS
jgi:hypothetical protein